MTGFVDYSRIKELLDGAEPEDNAEEVFRKTFLKASTGEPLINICIDDKGEMDYYGLYELQMFAMGYAIGQKDFLDKLGGLDLSKIKRDDNEEIH